MKTIHWKKEEVVNLGSFTGIIITESSLDGTIMKAFVYKGLSNDEVLVTSLLSENGDLTYLYSQVIATLSDKEHIEKIWQHHLKKKANRNTP